jgi:hypothetical protein
MGMQAVVTNLRYDTTTPASEEPVSRHVCGLLPQLCQLLLEHLSATKWTHRDEVHAGKERWRTAWPVRVREEHMNDNPCNRTDARCRDVSASSLAAASSATIRSRSCFPSPSRRSMTARVMDGTKSFAEGEAKQGWDSPSLRRKRSKQREAADWTWNVQLQQLLRVCACVFSKTTKARERGR